MSSEDPLAAPRSIKNGIIFATIFFWVPFGIWITWLVNR